VTSRGSSGQALPFDDSPVVGPIVAYVDGGARGNPGPAGFGVRIEQADGTLIEEFAESIGIATNNVAEYRGLIAGLEAAASLGVIDVAVRMDSKLVVEQMSGRWRVKHPDLIPLHRQAGELAAGFNRVSYAWIPRAKNSHADRLANEAMDAAAESIPETLAPAQEPASLRDWRGVSSAPTRLMLLRHGQTELSVNRRYSGRGNPALTELGRRQAAAAAQYLGARGGVDAVISSPLQRAQETAAAAAAALGLDVTVDDDLIETDFGDWEGLTFSEAAEHDPELHGRWMRDTSISPPGGESFDAVAHRVRRARNRLIAEHGSATVLVVSHVTPIKTMLQFALDAGASILHRLHLDLASLSVAEFYPDGPSSVRLVNQTAYLDGI
jgi:broad specificity phosphatase PhoE/ribonuclease HI